MCLTQHTDHTDGVQKMKDSRTSGFGYSEGRVILCCVAGDPDSRNEDQSHLFFYFLLKNDPSVVDHSITELKCTSNLAAHLIYR